ncbi:MAG: Nicotinamide-nucleotide amidohydrolase PncC [Verrucomicrobia bacterium ADurb.Bin345]|nr:MAG: Nicotinamide-nucleotide amidohydrolase PncC [Verrucomicrobia bacterium ADurb.Bin345]
MNPSIELVSTGSELLSGRTVNRHASVLGDHLRRLGLALTRDTTVPDNLEAIEEAVASALRRANVVLVSGGLGPTCDDITRDALARLLGSKVITDEAALAALRERFARMGRAVTPQAELQARIVAGGTALSNSVGAAPGERIERDGKTLFVLPGPPDEFLAVLTEHVLPWLREHGAGSGALRERMFLVCGLGESAIMELLEKNGFAPAGLDVAYSAAPGRIELRLLATGATDEELERAAAQVRRLLGPNVFAEERETMEEVVGRLLRRCGRTLATAESCTGGLLGSRITAVSGSSDYYAGGVVAYANRVKQAVLGVEEEVLAREGAVSEAVARQMAEGVRRLLRTSYGLSITGVAGPSGGTPEKPVGLVYIALAETEGTWVKANRFDGPRARVRDWSAQIALDMLRRRLLEFPPDSTIA